MYIEQERREIPIYYKDLAQLIMESVMSGSELATRRPQSAAPGWIRRPEHQDGSRVKCGWKSHQAQDRVWTNVYILPSFILGVSIDVLGFIGVGSLLFIW